MDDLREQVISGFNDFIEQRQKEIVRDCYGVEEATVPLAKVKQARDECEAYVAGAGETRQRIAFQACLDLFDRLIAEVEV